MNQKIYDQQQFFQSYFSRAPEKHYLVKLLLPYLLESEKMNKDSVSILDLGGHNGALMEKIYEAASINKNWEILAVEPSASALKVYAERQFMKKHGGQTICAKAEDFLETHLPKTKWDWILASQCLYWTPNLDVVLQQIYENSQNALIVMRGKKGIYQLQSHFQQYLGNPHEKLYSSLDIEKNLNLLNIPFQKYTLLTCLDLPSEFEQERKFLIDFFLQVNIDSLKEENYKEINQYIEKLSMNEKNVFYHEVVFYFLKNEGSFHDKK